MSADNFIAVFPSYDSLGRPERWYACEGMMPCIETPQDEIKWKKTVIKRAKVSYHTRAAALEGAHDMVKEISNNYNCPVVEYGVIELE